MLPVLLHPGREEAFPDPRRADAEGLVAVGGDLSVPRLLQAYDHGIFPWFSAENPELWWSPDPRAVIFPEQLHISKSMRRLRRRAQVELSIDRAFTHVMLACGENRGDGTWILPEMVDAYRELHRQGHAHSLEVWQEGQLVAGIYGVHRGGLFAGESMFHRVRDMSKLALIEMVEFVAGCGVELFDVQLMTPHLASMGAVSIPREEYLQRIEDLRDKPVALRP